MDEERKRGRGGDVRKSPDPERYYTGKEAWTHLKMSKQTFYRRVEEGMITRVSFPGVHDGYYAKEEIDLLATLREEKLASSYKLSPVTFRQATAADAQGVVDVLKSLGWNTTTPQLRIEWYAVNPQIDHIVLQGSIVMGYFSAVPYIADIMEKRLHGQIEAADIHAEDILPFEDGQEYNLFVGLAERKKSARHPHLYARYGMRLVLGFLRFLMEDLRKRDIRIKYLLGHSAELDGQRLAGILGFVQQEPQPQDKYPIYVLDMEHSDVPWVRRYRALWE